MILQNVASKFRCIVSRYLYRFQSLQVLQGLHLKHAVSPQGQSSLLESFPYISPKPLLDIQTPTFHDQTTEITEGNDICVIVFKNCMSFSDKLDRYCKILSLKNVFLAVILH